MGKNRIQQGMITDPITGLPTTKRAAAGRGVEEGKKSGGWKKPKTTGFSEGYIPNIIPWDNRGHN